MRTRRAELSDIPQIVEVERLAWPEGGAATAEQFKDRIATFPDGVIVALSDSNVVVGVVVGQIVESSFVLNGTYTWASMTDNGRIRSTHNPNGDTLFGVDLSVDPTFQGKGVGKKLLLEIGKMAIQRNLKMGVLGARMPDYHLYSEKISPTDYISLRSEDGKLIDKELRFYERSGLKLVRVVPDYYPDEESKNYGVIAVWKNPFYVRNKVLGKVIGSLGAMLFKI